MMKQAIEMQGVTKSLGPFHLGPLNLCIPEGSIVGYIGENGAGKSTTIKLLLGLLKADAGRIRILGTDIKDIKSDQKKNLAYVFEDLYLPGEMTLKQAENFHHQLYGESWQQKEFFGLIRRFHLSEDKAIKAYSRGMKMQLGMALALSHGAKILLLDEATSGLDPVIREEILDILLEFIQMEDHTVFISSHILSDIEKIADYIAFIHQGRLVFMENKDELKFRYGLVSMSRNQVSQLDPAAIVGERVHQFGVDLLVKRDLVPKSLELEKVSIEDIMVYMIKGDRL